MAELNLNSNRKVDEQSSKRVGKWFDDYARELRRYFLRNHFRGDEIDDLLHDVFVVALKKQEAYCEQGHAKAYLYRIAKNLMLATRRKRRPKTQEVADDEILDSPDSQIVTERKEQSLELRKQLGSISEEQRVVIQLRTEKGLTFKEISKTLDLALNTVLSHFHRGISRLRKLSKR